LDKSAIFRAVTVAGGRFAPGHLGELTRQVPFEMVDAALEETCRAERRVRSLPSRVVVYLLLAGCLFAELGYVQVWGRLTAGLGGLAVAAPTGVCQRFCAGGDRKQCFRRPQGVAVTVGRSR
jgi:hypothetical protein